MILNMNCKDIRELIVEHDGRIERLDAAGREHVESCAPCAREAELARRLADEARRTVRVQAPAGFTFRVMGRLRTEERTVWQKLTELVYLICSRRMAPAWALGAMVLLAVGLFLALPGDGPKNETAGNVIRKQNPPVPPVIAPPVVAANKLDFTLDGKALAYKGYPEILKGTVINYQGVVSIEAREDSNLMLMEGWIELTDGALAVSAPKDSCRLVVATETTKVTITGTAYEIRCRGGVTMLSVARGSVAVQTNGGESFTLSVGDAVRIGADGRKLRPVETGRGGESSGATGAAGQAAALAAVAGGPARGTGEIRLPVASGTEATPVLNVLDKLSNQGINGK